MDFDALAKLHWSQPTSGAVLSEQGTLRALVRKVLQMQPLERQRCSIVFGSFTYRRAEIEALTRHPDFSDAGLSRADSTVVRFRRPPRNDPP